MGLSSEEFKSQPAQHNTTQHNKLFSSSTIKLTRRVLCNRSLCSSHYLSVDLFQWFEDIPQNQLSKCPEGQTGTMAHLFGLFSSCSCSCCYSPVKLYGFLAQPRSLCKTIAINSLYVGRGERCDKVDGGKSTTIRSPGKPQSWGNGSLSGMTWLQREGVEQTCQSFYLTNQ